MRIERTAWESVAVVDRFEHYAAMTSGLLFKESGVSLDSIFFVRDLSYQWEGAASGTPDRLAYAFSESRSETSRRRSKWQLSRTIRD